MRFTRYPSTCYIGPDALDWLKGRLWMLLVVLIGWVPLFAPLAEAEVIVRGKSIVLRAEENATLSSIAEAVQDIDLFSYDNGKAVCRGNLVIGTRFSISALYIGGEKGSAPMETLSVPSLIVDSGSYLVMKDSHIGGSLECRLNSHLIALNCQGGGRWSLCRLSPDSQIVGCSVKGRMEMGNHEKSLGQAPPLIKNNIFSSLFYGKSDLVVENCQFTGDRPFSSAYEAFLIAINCLVPSEDIYAGGHFLYLYGKNKPILSMRYFADVKVVDGKGDPIEGSVVTFVPENNGTVKGSPAVTGKDGHTPLPSSGKSLLVESCRVTTSGTIDKDMKLRELDYGAIAYLYTVKASKDGKTGSIGNMSFIPDDDNDELLLDDSAADVSEWYRPDPDKPTKTLLIKLD